jgi:hypothetical protein
VRANSAVAADGGRASAFPRPAPARSTNTAATSALSGAPLPPAFAFRKICDGVFKTVDTDKNGQVDKDELVVAMCKMHYKLAKKSPGVTEPPTGEEVEEKLREYDVDGTGGLSKDEFYEFCKRWFDQKGVFFLRNLLVTSFISMVVLPESAGILHRELPAARSLPKVLFKVLFGVIFKLIATRLPAAVGPA